MIKKILIAVIGVFMLSFATFGAVVYTYDYAGCCKRVQMSEVNALFGGDFAVKEYIDMKSSSRYTSCELSGDCGCLNCEVSQMGVGFMNVRTSYDDKVVYSQNPPSMFVKDYDYCVD